jgi:peptide-methionine (S)-S-oxide reductase
MERLILGLGCFWGAEEEFRHLPGVLETSVGYSGGTVEFPTYQQVSSGLTGHTEVLEVIFDPHGLSMEQLLEHFWRAHDPTRQAKAQYQSVIFYTTPEQRPIIEASKEREAIRRGRPIVTVIAPAGPYWRAEEHHQCYIAKRKERIGW